MITKFRIFENTDQEETLIEGKYLKLNRMKNGNLKIILTPDGKEMVEEDGMNEDNFDDYFDDIRGNSEYVYFINLSVAGIGMSDAPCITDGYYYDDDGNLTDYDHIEDSEIFYYPNYITKIFTDELIENGFVIFVTNGKNTPEEVEEIKNKREINKYNL